ncbi:MAG: translocation/assembly module TamB, partial [Chitinophagaceae bacterium]|nr:translocation/assembly module TamB [Chitinophagaceae bacterium]
ITVNGLRGVIKQTKPIEITAVVINPDSTKGLEAPAFLHFVNKETRLSNIDIDYTNEVSNLAGKFSVANLTILPKNIDLQTGSIILNEVNIKRLKAIVSMGKSGGKGADKAVVKLTDENSNEVAGVFPWKISVNNIILDENALKFDDNTMPRLSSGMDFGHLDINPLTFHLQDFYFHNDTISGQVKKGSMREKSGFVLNNLQTKFAYNNKGVLLEDLLVQTPGSEIKRKALIKYPSLAAIQKNPGLIEMDVDIVNSRIQVKDILTFMPELGAQPAFKNPSAIIYVDSKITGSVSRLNIDHFKFRGLQKTNIDVSGTLYGLPDPNNVSANLSIRNFSTVRSDILSFVPPNTIPPTITLPENMALSGNIKGNAQQAVTDLTLNSSFGGAKLRGTISNAANPNNAKYNATISTNRLNVGAIIKNPAMVGTITANAVVSGRGYDPEKANAIVKGNIVSAVIKNYNYNNLQFNGAIANQHVTANATIKDPNIHLALQAEGFMGNELPGFNLVAEIDSIKTQPLHLTPDAIVYRGKIEARFPTLNLDALQGEAFITNSLLVMNNQRVAMDTISLLATYENNMQVIGLKTDFINANIRGTYKLQQLGDIMIQTIQPYYAINTSSKPVYVDPYNFTINASVIDHPTLRAFVPTLTRLDSVILNANFSNSGGMSAKLNAPNIIMGTNKVQNLQLVANTGTNGLGIITTVEQLNSGTSFVLYQTQLGATLANNTIDFGLLIKDKTATNKYHLQGLLSQINNTEYALKLKPDSLMLNYDKWTISPDNIIRFGTNIVNASNFALSRNNQQLIINSTTAQANSPLEVRFNNFEISTLTAFVQTDSLLANGTINGNVLLKNLQTQPNFTTDLTVSNLAINKDTIGNLAAKVNNATPNVFATNITLTGNGNDVSLTGNYYMKPADNSNLNFLLDIKKIELKTLEGPSMGMLSNASGYLSGKVDINGSAAAPKIDGGISFNQADFVVTMLNSQFKIDDEAIKVDNEGIKLNTFTIKDSANNTLVFDGAAYTKNFINYKFDMTVKANDFRAINSTKLNNRLYYGQLYFTSSLNIRGTETSPVVDGSIRVNEKTNLSMVIPQVEPGLVDRKGVIEFVDMDAPENDSLFLATIKSAYDSSFNKSQLVGFDISTNIEISKAATFNIIIDEANGDFLNMKGEGLLTGGIDPSGKITLTGTYEIEQGGYELSFNFLRRKFDIQKGGKITWTGEPTTGNLNVTAVYVANTAPLDLVGDQVATASKNIYMQKLPFEVLLNVTGELMQPILTFDIVLPKERNLRVSNEVISTVETRLAQLKSQPSELNKQVFALLLLNRFVGENPFESSGGGFNAGVYARQSVSRLLTEQLNKLATDLVAGVEINFDINSTEDYTTGQLANRTDFNVNLSKRLLNDRLRVSVGSNFELEGPKQSNQATSGVIGNVSVDYLLTKDGRYMLRGYRKNNYDAIVEGVVLETGLRFILTVDYNKFKEILHYGKERRVQKRSMKQAEDSLKKTNTTFIPDGPTTHKESGVVFEPVKDSADNRRNIPIVNNEPNDD